MLRPQLYPVQRQGTVAWMSRRRSARLLPSHQERHELVSQPQVRHAAAVVVSGRQQVVQKAPSRLQANAEYQYHQALPPWAWLCGVKEKAP